MKRAIYEWMWILAGCGSAAVLAFWGASIANLAPDLSLAIGPIYVSTSGGDAILAADLNSETILDGFDQSRKHPRHQAKGLRPERERRLALLGIKYHYIKFPQWTPWFLRISLLVPAFAAALLAAICFWRYWRLRPKPKATDP
jgi:hypothetical protein